jgi:hypothetical protein
MDAHRPLPYHNFSRSVDTAQMMARPQMDDING